MNMLCKVKGKFYNFIKNWIFALMSPLPLFGMIGIPRFLRDWILFQKKSSRKIKILDSHPCLLDWKKSTPFDPHYFYQAAWLSRKLADMGPRDHTDIGSDVRLIASLSAFIPVKFSDFRPLNVDLSNLNILCCDICSLPYLDNSINSLSSLHVVEHIGLGRYGDKIDTAGSAQALSELERVLNVGGCLYLTVPVGLSRICFNAHRIFSPTEILTLLPLLDLIEFSYVDDCGNFHDNVNINLVTNLDYACGMYVFTKR